MSYIIAFWDKSKLQVSDETGEKLKEAIMLESIKNFNLGDSLYAISGVEKIIPKDEAFTTYPAEWELLKDMRDRSLSKAKLLTSRAEQIQPTIPILG